MEPRRDPYVTVGEVFVWLLFFALLVPAGIVGWAIGHSTSGRTHTVTRTVTLAASATSATPSVKQSTAAKTTTATAPASTAGSAAKGEAVFVSGGCGSCHTFKPAGARGAIGPDLDTKPAIDAKKAHMPLAAFVRQSIVKPNAYLSPGYPKGVMPQSFAVQLSKMQLTDLVAFITSGK
ncbi:MAG: c-type cytochrome [Actinobacteria bacterium]|nr:c-type cytochrome [Actinomycetota bacterium]